MFKNTLSFLLSVSVILASFPAYSSTSTEENPFPELSLDLRISSIKIGEKAPFGGILLTPDSLTKMQLEFEKRIETLEIKAKYDEEGYQLHIGSLGDRLEQESLFRRNEIDLRDAYIEQLEEKYLEKDNMSPWLLGGSFIVGCLTTIAIAYSLQGAYK